MSTGLVAFLRARLDEDEQVARAALELAKPDERARTKWNTMPHGRAAELGIYPEAMLHAALHGPVRVLSEVEAKRRIITDYENYDREAPELDVPESVISLLALPYSDHRDYRNEWRP